MSREDLTRRLLLSNATAAERRTGIPRSRLERRKKAPDKITLSEFGKLSEGLEDELILTIVRKWR